MNKIPKRLHRDIANEDSQSVNLYKSLDDGKLYYKDINGKTITISNPEPINTPEFNVYFNQLTPTTLGVVFTNVDGTPGLGAQENTLYVSSINSSTWIYSNGSYVTPTITDSTPFYIQNTTLDAGDNKTLSIYRTGSIGIGGSALNTDKFAVINSGVRSLVVDVNGYVYNRGGGSISTNTAYGQNVLKLNTAGTSNTAIGYNALRDNTASANTAVGTNALYQNTTGSNNASIGSTSLSSNQTGGNNTAVGSGSLSTNISGSDNTSVGTGTLSVNTASSNTTVGYRSLYLNTTGSLNAALGHSALRSNSTGSNNTSFGANALLNLTTGGSNTAIGYGAGSGITTGSNNTIIGVVSGLSATLANNVIVADGSGNVRFKSDSTGAIAIGVNNTSDGVASLAMGQGSNTFTQYGRIAISSGNITAIGDVQKSFYILKGRSSSASAKTLTLDNSSSGIVLQNNNVFRFKGSIVGKQTGTTNIGVWDIDGIVVRGTSAATTTIVGTPTITSISNLSTWGTPTITADTTNGGLTINVVGLAATNIQWIADIQTSEIIY